MFFLPAAAHTEKDGNFTNTQRLLQWHHKAVEPPGDCRSELHWIYYLGKPIREKLAGSSDPKDRPILDLTWDYPLVGEHAEPDADAVLREISGTAADGSLLDSYDDLKGDGSTSCGSWIHCGIYKDGVNQSARKKPHTEQNWIAHEWGWAWPKDVRIIYNRASADPDGKPWSERKRYMWWDAGEGKWTGAGRLAGLPGDQGARLRARRRTPRRWRRSAATSRSSLHPDGRGWLYAPTGLVDGPLPAHYEPQESPFTNPLYAQHAEPDAPGVPPPREPLQPQRRRAGRRRVPVRAHDLPADRAPHGRRDVAHGALPGRAAARVLLRGLAASSPPSGPGARRMGHDRDRARRRSRRG